MDLFNWINLIINVICDPVWRIVISVTVGVLVFLGLTLVAYVLNAPLGPPI